MFDPFKVVEKEKLRTHERRYNSVNGKWPEGDLPPLTGPEAIKAARILYRLGLGTAEKRVFRLTSGNRYTYPKRGTWFVNPDKGWKALLHDISHYCHQRVNPKQPPHGPGHAYIERLLIDACCSRGFLDGVLKEPEKASVPRDVKVLQKRLKTYAGAKAKLKTWQTKHKRANTAIKKLNQQIKRLEKLGVQETA